VSAILISGLFVAVTSSATAQFATHSEAARVYAEQLDRGGEFGRFLDAYVPALMLEFPTPGVAVVVIANGQTEFFSGYGFADVASREPVTDTTLFSVASISKTLTAIAVMRLVDDGRVELDEPIETYLRRWSFPPSSFDSRGATVRRVLSHTSGLEGGGGPEYTPEERLPSLVEALNGDNKLGVPARLISEPGAVMRYSNDGYSILQLLVEDVTGSAFEDYMRREILRSLGMIRSSFDDPALPEVASQLATPYDWRDQPIPTGRVPGLGAAGLQSSATDLAQLVAVELAATRSDPTPVMPANRYLEMHEPQPNAGAFGLGHVIEDAESLRTVGHTGLIVGWNAAYRFAPGENAGIVVLTNGDNGYYVHLAIVDAWARIELGVRLNSRVAALRKRLARLIGVLGDEMVALTVGERQRILEPLEKAEREVGSATPEALEAWVDDAVTAMPAELADKMRGFVDGIRDWLLVI